MTRSEMLKNTLGIITRCEADSKEILSWEFLSKKDKETMERINTTCTNNRLKIESQKETISVEELETIFNYYYSAIYPALRAFQNNKEKSKAPVVDSKKIAPVGTTGTTPESKKVPVKVVKPEDQTKSELEATKKGKKVWQKLCAVLGVTTAALLIALVLKSCNVDKSFASDPTGTTTDTPESSTEQTLTEEELIKLRGIDGLDMDDVNIEDYSSLLAAAQKIQNAMPEDNKLPLEQIQYALVFGNLDQLADDKQGKVFREAEEIYAATLNLGIMLDDLNINADDIIAGTHPVLTEQELTACLVNVTDLKLTIDKFAEAKVDGGYDLYKVLEICGAGMDITTDDDLAFNYAATMNDIVAQVTRNFSMPSTASETEWSYLYTTLGIYNANKARILELTGGRHLSTIYGTGIRNDGTYGDICVEELMASSAIYHNNGTYTGPGKVVLYKDANGYEWPQGFVYEKDGKYYTDFVTDRDENGNVLHTETLEVTYSREVDPSAMLARDGDWMNAICNPANKGIGR